MSPRFRVALLATAAVLVLPSSAAAGAISIGSSNVFSAPGLAVDTAGTAYIAWRGPESGAGSLQFCRLPRGATACDSRHAIATPGDSVSRAFVVVSGSRVIVVQYRYGGVPGGYDGLLSYTSNDRGANFGPAVRIGTEAFNEAVVGPGDTLSGITNNASYFQNAPLGGGSVSNRAALSTDHLYNGTVGLIDAATPLAVFTDGSAAGQFRRYDGSGTLNDVANWSAPGELGQTQYPHLAGGPRGLFLLSTLEDKTLSARKFNGTIFGPPVTVATVVEQPSLHAFQDASGRLHAVFVHGDAAGLHLRHAVSDDGVAWRSGTVVTQTGSEGGFSSTRVATAPDHVGVVAWNAGSGQIRVAAVGPDAPVDPVPTIPPSWPPGTTAPATKPKPRITAKGSARRAGRKVRVRITGRLLLPAGVSRATGCNGKVKVTIKRGRKVVGSKTLRVRSNCAFALRGTLQRSKVKRAKRLVVTLLFRGNAVLSPARKAGSLKLKG
jgi:hypothetical protein